MSSVDELLQLRKEVDEVQKQAHQSEGALAEIMKQFKKEGCDDLDDVEKLLKKLNVQELKAKRKYEEAKKRFEKKWLI